MRVDRVCRRTWSTDPGLTREFAAPVDASLDAHLSEVLAAAGMTGTIESQLVRRLGRPIDSRRANLGRMLWFDSLPSLHHDNTCGGCHSPTNGFGDTQSIAIGVQNNQIVGRKRSGPRNQRRSPLVIYTAFFPVLMWNGRFSSPSGIPSTTRKGSCFLPPKATLGSCPAIRSSDICCRRKRTFRQRN
jgi:cytochrome c peroxidase